MLDVHFINSDYFVSVERVCRYLVSQLCSVVFSVWIDLPLGSMSVFAWRVLNWHQQLGQIRSDLNIKGTDVGIPGLSQLERLRWDECLHANSESMKARLCHLTVRSGRYCWFAGTFLFFFCFFFLFKAFCYLVMKKVNQFDYNGQELGNMPCSAFQLCLLFFCYFSPVG